MFAALIAFPAALLGRRKHGTDSNIRSDEMSAWLRGWIAYRVTRTIYKKLMPDPKPARATVQVAGLIGGAKIEISAIAVKH
jgi:enamine deaminase RidA (YjgF/YER057c/UK114 family)